MLEMENRERVYFSPSMRAIFGLDNIAMLHGYGNIEIDMKRGHVANTLKYT